MKTDPVQLLGCRPIKAPGHHCQTSACRTELIEQRIDAMLQQDVTGTEADDMDLVLSVVCILLKASCFTVVNG